MLNDIGDVLRECYNLNWITCRDGNVSFKYANSDVVYLTPSGVDKRFIYEEKLVTRTIVDGELLGNNNATGELRLHQYLMASTKEQRCVLHVHPTHIVAAMYADLDLQKITADFPEIYRYTQVGPSVESWPALSEELARDTAFNLGLQSDGRILFDIVGQKNHGVTAVGRSPNECFEHVSRLEHICKIVLASGKYKK